MLYPLDAYSYAHSMETITDNLKAQARRVTRNGREYLVCPVSLIVPGVLNGSKGALFYPPEEVARNPEAWNGIPIVRNHPVDPVTNAPVSARHPDVEARHTVGRLYSARYAGKLRSEAWIDVADALRVDKRIVDNILSGKPTEVSTGLYTENVEAPTGSHFNGKPYTHVARNYRPDHLAVLLDEKGACCVDDGCGLLVNRIESITVVDPMPVETTVVGTDVTELGILTDNLHDGAAQGGKAMADRKQTIEWLTTNCECWKDPEGKEALEGFKDERLTALRGLAEAAIATNVKSPKELFGSKKKSSQDTAEAKEGADPNADSNEVEGDKEDTDETTGKAKKGKVKGGKPVANQQTLQEYLASAPEEVKIIVNSGLKAREEKRARLINHITINLSTEEKAGKVEELRKLADEQLDLFASLVKAPAPQVNNRVFGNSQTYMPDGGVTDSLVDNAAEDDVLLPPTMNYDPLPWQKNGQ